MRRRSAACASSRSSCPSPSSRSPVTGALGLALVDRRAFRGDDRRCLPAVRQGRGGTQGRRLRRRAAGRRQPARPRRRRARPHRRQGLPGRPGADEADLEKSKASLEGVGSALIQQQARIVEAKADVANLSAALAFARQEDARYAALYARGAGTSQRTQQAVSDLNMKTAALDKANAGYDAAQKQVDGLRSLEAAARATLRRSQINLRQAQLNIGYATVTAPIDGIVGDRSVRRGQLVQPGTNLLTVVPMGEAIFLVANFKETQIGRDEGSARRRRFKIDALGRSRRSRRPHGQLRAGHRLAVRAPASGERHGQLHQDRAARARALPPGRPGRPDDRDHLLPGLSAEAMVRRPRRGHGQAAVPKPAEMQRVSQR